MLIDGSWQEHTHVDGRIGHMYVCMYACMYVCIYVCMYMYVCMYVCMYVYYISIISCLWSLFD